MMNPPHRDGPATLFRMAVFALGVGLLATTGCAPDPAQSVLAPPNTVRADLLQSENLVPDFDISNPGGLQPFGALWKELDEDTPDDDLSHIWRVRIGQPPTSSEATVRLSNPVGPRPDPSQAHTLKVRWKVDGNYSTLTPQPTKLIYSLIHGGTVLATKMVFPSGQNYITDSVSVSPLAANQSYDDLEIFFKMDLKPTSPPVDTRIEGRITWARLEIR